MVTLSCPAEITISDSKPNSPPGIPFFNLLIESLTNSLSVKRDTPLTVAV